jgi:hypothetical protein
MKSITSATMMDIVNKYFWKSSLEEMKRSLILAENHLSSHSFVNPLGVIRSGIIKRKCLQIRICKWHPQGYLPCIKDEYIVLSMEWEYKYGIEELTTTRIGTDTLYLSQDCVYELCRIILEDYHKKCTRITFDNECVYSSDINQFSSANPHIQKIAVLKIEHAWIAYMERYKLIFNQCLDEIVLIPTGGYSGKNKSIRGGIEYLRTKTNYENICW